MARLIFIVDDLRHEDLCFELNQVVRQDDDIVVVCRDARSAVMTLCQLAVNHFAIDITMLDHDLGDGLDTSWFLNWLLGMVDADDPQYLDAPLKFIGPILKNTQWFYHTSNIGTIPSMKSKVSQIQKWLDNHID